MSDPEHRRAELVGTLGALRTRLAAACEGCGRDPRSITVVAVTKNRPASDIAALAALGVRDVGESKDQQARAKIAALGTAARDLRWHMVGRLQSNKAAEVARYAHAVHSVDRLKLVRALCSGAQDRAEPLEVFVQVSLDGDPDRGGVRPEGVDALADAVAGEPGLHLRGLMAVPPIGSDPDEQFARLAELSAALRARHLAADALSAGMSTDLEAAVRNGATHVRVGTALLGRRDPDFG